MIKPFKKYTNIRKDERRCQTCPNEVEDEYHFLFKYQRNLAMRREFLNQIESIESGFNNKESKEKVLASFASKNSKVINLFAKYVFQSFSVKKCDKRVPCLCLYSKNSLSLLSGRHTELCTLHVV